MLVVDEGGGTKVFSFKLGGPPFLLWLIVPSSVALILNGLSSALEARRAPVDPVMVLGETSDSLSLAVAIEVMVLAADRGGRGIG